MRIVRTKSTIRMTLDENDPEMSMQEPTSHMLKEAASSGFYHSDIWNRNYPRLQILTINDLLDGKGVDMPPLRQVDKTFKRAPRAKGVEYVTDGLRFGETDTDVE